MPTVLENSPKSKSKLWTIIHRDPQKEIFLKNYSDTVIFDSSNGTNHLIAVRFGGYPEHARAMADAIYGGGSAIVQTDDGEIVLSSYTKRYRIAFTG